MSQKTDLLYQILSDYINCDLFSDECERELIARVADAYLEHLLDQGTIAEKFIAEIREDIEEEARAMYLKKTYGHYSLKEYRKSRVAEFEPAELDLPKKAH